MTDRDGTPLSAGDPVHWYVGDIDGVLEISATVLAVVADGYLIQLNQHGPGWRERQLLQIAEAKIDLSRTIEALEKVENSAQQGRLEFLKELLAELNDPDEDGLDTQEPFVVAGDGLEKIIGDD
jgi:hypothetical protein